MQNKSTPFFKQYIPDIKKKNCSNWYFRWWNSSGYGKEIM